MLAFNADGSVSAYRSVRKMRPVVGDLISFAEEKYGIDDAAQNIHELCPLYTITPRSKNAAFTCATVGQIENDFKHQLICGSDVGALTVLSTNLMDKKMLN